MRGHNVIVLLVFCLLILQADGQTTTSTDRYETIEDLRRVDSFLPETKESDFSSLAGLEAFGVTVGRFPAGIAKEDLTKDALRELVVSRLGKYGIGVSSLQQVQQTENRPLLVVNVTSVADMNKDICVLLCSLALEEDVKLTGRKTPASQKLARCITWQRFEIKLCTIQQLAGSIATTVDYLAALFAREFLAANPSFKKIEQGDENMISGTVRYIDIEGGFYGLVADTGEKYDPVNLPEDFRQDGLKVKFAVKEKKGVVSFRMWGKIVEILKIQQADMSSNAVFLQWLGHASFRISSQDKVIYIDPWKLKDAKHDASVVLVSHSHSDHYSSQDIQKVSTENTRLISSADVIAKEGWGQTIKPAHAVEVSGIKITAVPAYNPAKQFHPRDKDWLGFVIDMAGLRIYYAGDTDLTDEMKALKNIDVAMLPVGGTYTMDANEAAEAVKYIKPRKAIPYHYGDIVGSPSDAKRFADLAGCEVIVMTPGEIKRIND